MLGQAFGDASGRISPLDRRRGYGVVAAYSTCAMHDEYASTTILLVD